MYIYRYKAKMNSDEGKYTVNGSYNSKHSMEDEHVLSQIYKDIMFFQKCPARSILSVTITIKEV